MAGNIIVIVIVCLAAFYIGKRIFKTFSGRKVGCGCGSQEGCGTLCEENQDSDPGHNA